MKLSALISPMPASRGARFKIHLNCEKLMCAQRKRDHSRSIVLRFFFFKSNVCHVERGRLARLDERCVARRRVACVCVFLFLTRDLRAFLGCFAVCDLAFPPSFSFSCRGSSFGALPAKALFPCGSFCLTGAASIGRRLLPGTTSS